MPRAVIHRSTPELALYLTLSAALSLLGLAGVAWAAGVGAVTAAVRHYDLSWFPLGVAAEAAAYVGYTLAYREVARVEEGPSLRAGEAAAAVATGFGAFIARGGFALDLHVFRERDLSARHARVRVLGLGALEYAVVAPAACAAAFVLLVERVHVPATGLTLPWAIGVPAGAVVVLPLLALRHRIATDRSAFGEALDSVYVLRCLFVRLQHVLAPAGVALYWFGDILCLWACLRIFEPRPLGVAQLLIGYATGYALTRRTLPFAGAGAVEALLPFALSWAGTPLAAAVPAVVMYRLTNLWLPILPAVAGMRRLSVAR